MTQNRGYFLKRKSPLCQSAHALHAMAPPNRRKKSCVRVCAASVTARIGKPQKQLQKRLSKPKMRERDKLSKRNNCTRVKITYALLKTSCLRKCFWSFVNCHARFLIQS